MRPPVAILAAVVLAVPSVARAEAIVLHWGDLIPAAAAPNPADELERRLGLRDDDRTLVPRGMVQHGQFAGIPGGGADVVTAYNGKTVTLTGYAIPLDYSAEGASSFMLVPFVGACIHVPPPPPNQLVFVTVETPVAMEGVFDPYTVTGTLGTTTTETELAEVGYTLAADVVVPYDGGAR